MVTQWLDARAREMLNGPGAPRIDFSAPAGEPAFAPTGGVSQRVFANPVSVYIGGAAAVILELAEPRVRTGVWERTTFRTDPVGRLRRTGMAAMATVYAAQSVSRPMIAAIGARHQRIAGVTPAGEPFRADDPELLTYVHATAAFGFLEAYCAYVSSLSEADRDRYYAEGQVAARLYGADRPPQDCAALQALFAEFDARLEPSPIIFEFLDILAAAPALPEPLRRLQPLFVRAAVSLTPPALRDRLRLNERGLRRGERALMRAVGGAAERLALPSHPAAIAALRCAKSPG